MKLKIEKENVSIDQIEQKLKEGFPQYEVRRKSKTFLVVKKSGSIGCNVVLKKNKIIVAGNFPSFTAQLLFILCLLIPGILITLIVYFIAFHGKFKRIEKEVADLITNQVLK